MMEQGAKDPALVGAFLKTLNRVLIESTGFAKPLVAAQNGHTVAGGFILAACMDYRLMRADRGFIRLPEVQINIPFWPGMTALFQAILTPQTLRTMFLTGERFSSQQALEMGAVDELCDAEKLLPRAIELAEMLGRSESATYATVKRGMRAHVLRVMREEDPAEIDAFVGRINLARTH
ncbi:MAG: enoyl-CoA hydratase/isomerase family protein [Deltaproteobacteria bacterium]|nr:enoyl-CoA hydratase/isomerase family protein [Deltaproteobacteria bacterium]